MASKRRRRRSRSSFRRTSLPISRGRRRFSRGRRGGSLFGKYLPRDLLPLAGGAAIGAATGSAIRQVLVAKAVQGGKADGGFFNSDLGAILFDIGHAAASHALLPRSLGRIRTGYTVGAAMPTAIQYAVTGVGKVAEKLLPGQGVPRAAAAPAPTRPVANVAPTGGTAAAQPSRTQQIVDAVAQVINRVTQPAQPQVAGFYDDGDDGSTNNNLVFEDGPTPGYVLSGW